MRKKTSSRYNKKRTKSRVGSDNQLEGLTYHYRDIQWFWQFLKLAVDYEGKKLNVGGRLIWKMGSYERAVKFVKVEVYIKVLVVLHINLYKKE